MYNAAMVHVFIIYRKTTKWSFQLLCKFTGKHKKPASSMFSVYEKSDCNSSSCLLDFPPPPPDGALTPLRPSLIYLYIYIFFIYLYFF